MLRCNGLTIETSVSSQYQSTSRAALDLLLDVDTSAGRRAGVESALRTAIRDGRLQCGDALPSTRALAHDLGLARATVVAAYEQLAAEGYVVGRRGSATTVSYAPPERIGAARPAESTIEANTALARSVTFHPGRPDLSGFPRRDWRAALRTVLNTVPDSELDYPDPAGCPQLRGSLASYLGRTRATQSTASDILVTGGFLPALGIVADHFRRRGHGRIVVEDPMLYLYRLVLEYFEIDVVPVSVDREGISVAALERVDVPVDAVLVCPSRHYPLGITMSAERRADLVQWAREYDTWVIEDDYDGEFRYDGRPVGALQGLAPDRVVHAGTASKSLAPGLRLGWMTVPEPLRRAIAPAILARGPTSVIDQLTLSELIDSGAYDRQIRGMRSRYRRRRDRVVAMLETVDGLRLPESAAGLNICARFVGEHRRVDDLAVESACIAAGVGVVALSRHYAAASNASRGIVVGFAAPAEHEFRSALDRLRAVLDKALNEIDAARLP